MDQKRHWLRARSVATRTTIIMVCVVVVVLLTIGIWQVQRVRSIVSEEVRREASHSMEGAIKVMDNRISNVETALQTAASYADIFAGEERRVYVLLHRLLESNKDIDADVQCRLLSQQGAILLSYREPQPQDWRGAGG